MATLPKVLINRADYQIGGGVALRLRTQGLIEAAKQNRSGHRDATAILVAYRHGLRGSEIVALRWDDIDLTTRRLHVRRAKGGDASVHPISARESRAMRKLLREAPTPYVFISERSAPLSAAGYQR